MLLPPPPAKGPQAGWVLQPTIFNQVMQYTKVQVSRRVTSALKGRLLSLTPGLLNISPEFLQEETKAWSISTDMYK